MNETATMNAIDEVHELANQQCQECQTGAPPLKGAALQSLHRKLGPEWRVINEHHLEREFKFENFREALEFTNRIGALAEEQNHHPDIYLTWGEVRVTLWTHKVDGLSQSDFVMAAKIEGLPR